MVDITEAAGASPRSSTADAEARPAVFVYNILGDDIAVVQNPASHHSGEISYWHGAPSCTNASGDRCGHIALHDHNTLINNQHFLVAQTKNCATKRLIGTHLKVQHMGNPY